MGATAVGTLILLEIPGAALIAAAFLGQTPPLLALPAALLLLAGLAIVVRAGSRGTVPALRPGATRPRSGDSVACGTVTSRPSTPGRP